MLRILAGMDQKDCCSGIYMAGFACDTMHLALCSLPCFAGPFLEPMFQTVQNSGEFTQVQFLDEVVIMPVVGQRLALMVQTVPKPVEFPQVQSFPLLWRRGKSPWSR